MRQPKWQLKGVIHYCFQQFFQEFFSVLFASESKTKNMHKGYFVQANGSIGSRYFCDILDFQLSLT